MTGRRLPPLAAALGLVLTLAGQAGAELPDGRALFHGHQPFAAGQEATASRLPPAVAACAGCHGALAEGRREGGVTAPPIGRAALITARAERPGYASDVAIRQAILSGVGRGGVALAAAMPRYRLNDDETGALLAFLGRVGTSIDLPPGVTPEEVALGTVLPLSGAAAASGQAVLQGLLEAFDAANARGGVYGRRVTLRATDGAAMGPAAAVRVLLTRPVHAVVAGVWSGGDAADAVLAEARVPHVGSLVLRASARDAGPWVADLLPPLSVQQAALTRAMEACEAAGPHAAVAIGAMEPEGADSDNRRVIRWFQDAAALAKGLPNSPGEGCIGGGLADFAGLSRAAPAGWRRQLVLPVPAALMGIGEDGRPADLWRQFGRAAGSLALELLSRAGAVLHERAMLAPVSALAGYAPLPGAAVQFNRHRRYAWDAAVVDLPPTGAAAPARATASDQGG